MELKITVVDNVPEPHIKSGKYAKEAQELIETVRKLKPKQAIKIDNIPTKEMEKLVARLRTKKWFTKEVLVQHRQLENALYLSKKLVEDAQD